MELETLSYASSSPLTTPMSNKASELGTCPFCGSAIPAGAILVEYEVEDETRLFAECLECDEPVQPQ